MTLLSSRDRDELSAHFGERVHFDEPLAAFTSWKIGGPADALIEVQNSDDVAFLLRLAVRRRLPWFVLGSGSNVLIGDGGMRGLVLRLGGAYSAIDISLEEGWVVVRAGAAASLSLLVGQAASRGADGVWSLAGVPGSVGGALRMNAGTDKETGDFVRCVTVQTPSKPHAHEITPTYYYRRTTLARDAIVASVTFAFARADAASVRAELQRRLVRRKSTQPLAWPNAGSCFRNPENDRAGRLIEAAGAKGWRVGGAEVSDLHANFIVNSGGASALDVTTLLARVRRAVSERFAVDLHLEVHLVGEFVDALAEERACR